MRYAIYNFLTDERSEEAPRGVQDAVIDHDTQCWIGQSTTVEDEKYLGTDWQCDHCLPPTECIHCNPVWRDADLAVCNVCHPQPGATTMTWHTPDGVCLECKE